MADQKSSNIFTAGAFGLSDTTKQGRFSNNFSSEKSIPIFSEPAIGWEPTKTAPEPEKIFANAKTRIAETAGCTVRDVEHIIKQYTKMRQQMALVQRMGGMEAVMEKMKKQGN